MKIEIITTGNEILDGRVTNTNASWIAQKCTSLGHEIIKITSVGDDKTDIGNALKSASHLAECVIVSGGLGPTTDDITIESASKAFGTKLELNSDALKKIKTFFKAREIEMPKSNEKQAMLPIGSIALENKVGTAPGVQVLFGNSTFFFLPGVPSELYQIFDDFIHPWLEQRCSGFHEKKILRCFGISESEIAQKLKKIDSKGVYTSYRVPFPEILITLFANSNDPKETIAMIEHVALQIYQNLGDVVYSEGEETLPIIIGKRLTEHSFKIAVAESCTGGALSSLITDSPGASTYFDRGLITYSNLAKEEILGVDPAVISQKGSVSEEVALMMARGVKKSAKTDIGIGITGIAGPTGGTKDKPTGLVFIAICAPSGDIVEKFVYPAGREKFKRLVSFTALNMLRKLL